MFQLFWLSTNASRLSSKNSLLLCSCFPHCHICLLPLTNCHKHWYLKTTQIYSLTVLEVEVWNHLNGLKARSWQGWFLPDVLREKLVFLPFSAYIFWLVASFSSSKAHHFNLLPTLTQNPRFLAQRPCDYTTLIWKESWTIFSSQWSLVHLRIDP